MKYMERLVLRPIAVQNFVAYLAKNTGLKMPQNLK